MKKLFLLPAILFLFSKPIQAQWIQTSGPVDSLGLVNSTVSSLAVFGNNLGNYIQDGTGRKTLI